MSDDARTIETGVSCGPDASSPTTGDTIVLLTSTETNPEHNNTIQTAPQSLTCSAKSQSRGQSSISRVDKETNHILLDTPEILHS